MHTSLMEGVAWGEIGEEHVIKLIMIQQAGLNKRMKILTYFFIGVTIVNTQSMDMGTWSVKNVR